jgi:hypothetical protein
MNAHFISAITDPSFSVLSIVFSYSFSILTKVAPVSTRKLDHLIELPRSIAQEIIEAVMAEKSLGKDIGLNKRENFN